MTTLYHDILYAMYKQKGLAPILIILLIALVIGGYLFIQKQPKPVSQPFPSPIASDETVYTEASRSVDRKTYTNDQYGYTISNPGNISLEENQIGGGVYSADDPYRYGIWLDKQIWISVSDKSVLDKCPADSRDIDTGCPTIDLVENITVNNYPAKKINGHQGNMIGIPGKYQVIEIPHLNKFYKLYLYALNKDDRKAMATTDDTTEIPKDKILLFNQILSTFKFIQ